LFGSISKENGIEILDEMVYNNNVHPLTSEQQIELVVRWFIKKQQEVNVKIVIYIDNAHLRYFYETFNATFKRIAFQYNMYGSELVFAPAIKHAI
jgi:phage terminase, large subunit, PBSX family